MELHAVKVQMQNVKNAGADMKRFGNIALILFVVPIPLLNDDK